jgi:hypothetical protein
MPQKLQDNRHIRSEKEGHNMKKAIALVLILILAAMPVLAEQIDLSGLSFDELRQLQTRISHELTTRPEWKSVTVPAGFYQVGVDIPAATWTITCGKSMFNYVHVRCGKKTNASKTDVDMPWEFSKMICQPGTGDGTNLESLTVSFYDGDYVNIEYGEAIFSTPERTDLGF